MRGKILVADNDEDYRKALVRFLSLGGYDTFGAGSPQEAEEIIRKERIHLAILDKRLVDDNDPSDESGIELAKRIDPIIYRILLTKYETSGKKVAAIRRGVEPIANEFIEKGEGYKAIGSVVETAFKEKIRINFDLKVVLKDDSPSGTRLYLEDEEAFESLLDEISIKGKEAEEEKKKMGEELGEVFKKLFYEEDKITISSLSSKGYSGTGVVWVKPSKSDGGIGAPSIVKFGGCRAIEIETKNYDIHVKRYLTRRCTKREELVYTQNFGGIGYTFVGSSLKDICDFRERYGKGNEEAISRILKGLFKETCELWYKNKNNIQDMELTGLYREQLGFTQTKLDKALKDIFPDYRGKTLIKFPGLEKDFINPVAWLKDRIFHFSTYRCRTHGDLNGKNILVDEDGHTWLIDFFRTGYGHILRDFVELEADIKFNYLETSNIEALYEFEKSLVSPKEFDEQYNFKSNISELDKAFAVIKGLRDLAHSVVEPGNDIWEYYIGLLYHTINIIRYPNLRKERLRHALLSASLICERLEKW